MEGFTEIAFPVDVVKSTIFYCCHSMCIERESGVSRCGVAVVAAVPRDSENASENPVDHAAGKEKTLRERERYVSFRRVECAFTRTLESSTAGRRMLNSGRIIFSRQLAQSDIYDPPSTD